MVDSLKSSMDIGSGRDPEINYPNVTCRYIYVSSMKCLGLGLKYDGGCIATTTGSSTAQATAPMHGRRRKTHAVKTLRGSG